MNVTSTLRFGRAIAALALAAAATTASAGLYPPAAPPGSAFIRVFNGTTQPKISAEIGGKNVGDTPSLEASPYIFLAPGSYPAKIGSATSNVPLQASKCYTAALEQSGVHLFEQDCFNSQLKALVSVFNLVDGSTVSLKTADGSQGVVENVAANGSGHREVNPVKANLALYNGTTKMADAKPVTLERGKTYSLFVTGSANQPVLIWSVN
jgi:alginate O-acetyltransferase complex protein AlgF